MDSVFLCEPLDQIAFVFPSAVRHFLSLQYKASVFACWLEYRPRVVWPSKSWIPACAGMTWETWRQRYSTSPRILSAHPDAVRGPGPAFPPESPSYLLEPAGFGRSLRRPSTYRREILRASR